MARKLKKMIKNYVLGSLMLTGCSFLTNEAINNRFNQNRTGLESKLEMENTLSPEEINKQEKYKLIENAINADIQKRPLSVDSVIKFVGRDELQEYFNSNNIGFNYEKDKIALNRLRAVLKSSDEIEQDRFRLDRSPVKSFKKLNNYLGITPGVAENNFSNSMVFFNLYKDNIIESANKYNIDPVELVGLMKHESGLGTFIASRTGALGSAQLTSHIYNPKKGTTLDTNKKSNPFNTIEAIDRAAEYLGHLKNVYARIDDSQGTLRLTAYNRGEGDMNRAINLAKSYNVRNPRDIVNFIDPSNNSYVLASEGRNFAPKVRREASFMNSFFKEPLADNYSK
jgi:hypothetical protein